MTALFTSKVQRIFARNTSLSRRLELGLLVDEFLTVSTGPPSLFSFPSFSFSSSVLVTAEKDHQPRRIHYYHNVATSIAALQSCARNKDLQTGKQLHAFMLRNGFVDRSPLAVTSLINMYTKCDEMEWAVSTFKSYDQNVFGYNAIISGFVTNGLPLDGLEFYREMRVEGVMPDRYTFPCLIKGCCDAMELVEVKKINGLVFKLGLDSDAFVGSAFVNCYLKFVLMDDAQKLFDELPERDDIVVWNAMISGYTQTGCFEDALDVFMEMREQGIMMNKYTVTGVLSAFAVIEDFNNGRAAHAIAVKMGCDSSTAVSNALIDMYGKCKRLSKAREIFMGMVERDIFSWNSIMYVHKQCGDHGGTLTFFHRMAQQRLQPDLVTLTTVLPACANLVALMHGRELHGYMILNGLVNHGRSNESNDILINNAVMDMYAKCGNMRNACSVFNSLSRKDVASWNIMITGYGMHGYGREALEMFQRMCNAEIKPDEVTFVGVLSACSHAGFISEGRGFLAQMETKYGVVPTIEHYTCVVDMLGRAGKLDEAYELASTMPVEINPVAWRALLAACRLHGNADLAEIAAKRVLEIEPEHCGNYVLMSNVYVATARYEEVLDVRDSMREQNVRKTPGCSWIELKNCVHSFVTGDRSHSKTESIYDKLNLLTAHLRSHGYIPEA